MIVVLMGVTGSGKTTVGKVLAKELGWKFYDADDYHRASNVEKMHKGIPLTDEDRKPWLQTRYVCLCGSEELIKERLAARTGHFMNPALLDSQFEILEPPDDAIRVDVAGSPREIADEIRRRLGL